MFKRFFIFSFYFILSFLILSIPIQKTPLFNHLSDVFSPITESLFSESKNVIKKSGRIFKNANPPKKKDAPIEISDEDKQKVEKLLK